EFNNSPYFIDIPIVFFYKKSTRERTYFRHYFMFSIKKHKFKNKNISLTFFLTIFSIKSNREMVPRPAIDIISMTHIMYSYISADVNY
ncbi:MAG: hypothetical protein IJZ06_05195, partial [Bacteroidales bacterium]|nr:hypothetical protein [Bacteroidales bacterium]